MNGLVIAPKHKINNINILAITLAGLIIYSCIIPFVIADIWISIYQAIYFEIMGIPKISRRKYIIIDRHHLNKLNLLQKINCVYCEYINGLIPWLKAVANQTEIYSCAIKHQSPTIDQKHQENFYNYEDYI